MELKLDIEKFEEYQEILVREVVEQIRFKLAKDGIRGRQLQDLTLEVAFSVFSTIDDTAAVAHEGVEARPFLTFQGEDNQLIHCGENSNAHEFVSEIVGKVFSN